MKFRELKSMTPEEIKKKELEMKTELMKLRAQVATGTNPENSGKIKLIKRTLAKMKTARRPNK